eukprot:bmy_19732T0
MKHISCEGSSGKVGREIETSAGYRHRYREKRQLQESWCPICLPPLHLPKDAGTRMRLSLPLS